MEITPLLAFCLALDIASRLSSKYKRDAKKSISGSPTKPLEHHHLMGHAASVIMHFVSKQKDIIEDTLTWSVDSLQSNLTVIINNCRSGNIK